MKLETTPRKRSYRWPFIIVSLLAGHVSLMCWAVAKATSDKNAVVIEDYYNKATHWDKTQAEQIASDKLGWQVMLAAAASPDAQGQRSVTLHLTDAKGAVITPDEMSLVGYHQAHAEKTFSAKLDSSTDGFAATLPMPHAGVYHFNFIARAGDKTFVHQWTQQISNVAR